MVKIDLISLIKFVTSRYHISTPKYPSTSDYATANVIGHIRDNLPSQSLDWCNTLSLLNQSLDWY